jgi:8-oxo-dGTP pyrophosphatase MutT (NUDIX family)
VDGRDRVAVVRRNRHGGDWTLPKGHSEAGETLQATAVREVCEETGWRASPVSLAGATSYATDEGQKYVLFWLMDAEERVANAPARGEVVAVEWLEHREARRRLSYQQEIEVLARCSSKKGGRRGVKLFRVVRDPRPERLEEAIQIAWSSLARSSEVRGKSEPAWFLQATSNLRCAETALALRELDRGWALVHRAHELEVLGYDDDQVTAEAVTLKAELLSRKFSGWRRAAITEHLEYVLASNAERDAFVLPLHQRRVWLSAALRTRDESYSNEYRNLTIQRRYQAVLLAIALVILVGALIGSVFANPELRAGVDKWWVALSAALSGALGGITSAVQRTSRRPVARIPERLGSLVHSLSRPIIGAIAGVTVFLAVRAGMTQTTNTSEQQVAYLLLLAFGAGFSERLVVRDTREETSSDGSRASTTWSVPVAPRNGRDDNSNAVTTELTTTMGSPTIEGSDPSSGTVGEPRAPES